MNASSFTRSGSGARSTDGSSLRPTSIEPFVLRHFGVDPATATGPMITTTTDLLSNAFYFTLASWLLLK